MIQKMNSKKMEKLNKLTINYILITLIKMDLSLVKIILNYEE